MVTTTRILLEKQTTGSNDNSWGGVLNGNADLLDKAIAGLLTKSVAGASATTLTDAEAINATHEYTGTLSGNKNVIVPTREKTYECFNNTSGAFTLTIKTSAGTGIVLTQGQKRRVYCDGTNVVSTATAVGKHSKWIPARDFEPTVSAGMAALALAETTAGRPDMQYLAADASSEESAQYLWLPPSNWNRGTVTAVFYWTHGGGQTGGLDGVAFKLAGVAVNDDDTIDVAYGTAITMTAKNGVTAEDWYESAETAAITIGGTPSAGDGVYLRVSRDIADGGDDLDIDARFLGVKVIYTINRENED